MSSELEMLTFYAWTGRGREEPRNEKSQGQSRLCSDTDGDIIIGGLLRTLRPQLSYAGSGGRVGYFTHFQWKSWQVEAISGSSCALCHEKSECAPTFYGLRLDSPKAILQSAKLINIVLPLAWDLF